MTARFERRGLFGLNITYDILERCARQPKKSLSALGFAGGVLVCILAVVEKVPTMTSCAVYFSKFSFQS